MNTKSNLLKFASWEVLFESKLFESALEDTKTQLEQSLGELAYVPNFEVFERPGEPEQTSHLFSDKAGHSFSLNVTKDGNLFSVDFWKPTSTKPESTLYLKGKSLKEAVPMILWLIKDPNATPEEVAKKIPVGEAKTSAVKVDVKSPKPKEEKEELPQYEFGDPKTIFEDLKKYADMVIKGIQPSLLITGSPGAGKTFIVTQQIKKSGLEKGKDWIAIKGKSTAAGMYQALYEHNGKLIIFDDCDSIFKDDDAVNILKGALDSSDEREISWLAGRQLKLSDGSLVPNNFIFTGRVIFISNLAQKNLDDAIKSRSFVLEVALSPKDMVKYVEDLLPKVVPEEPMSVKKVALSAIKGAAAKNKNVQINMRTMIKAIRIIKHVSDLDIAKRMIVQQCSYK